MRLILLAITLGCVLQAACASGPTARDVQRSSVDTTTRFTFDADPTGRPPAGWRIEATRSGVGGEGAGLAQWSVVADASGPSAPNALALTASTHGEQDTFNLCWTDRVTFRDGRLRVALKVVGGEVDRGGGLIWRVQGRDDYSICRYNPLERNFRLYRVVAGVRHQLDSELAELAPDGWHVIEVVVDGAHVTCTLDGAARLEAEDDALPQGGGVGVWTKADAVTSFDELSIDGPGR